MLKFVFTELKTKLEDDEWIDLGLRTSGFNLEDYWKLARNFYFVNYKKEKVDKSMIQLDTYKQIRKCLAESKPITLSFASATPNVKWSDIGGYEDVKKLIYRVIELPMRNPELFKKRGIKPSKVFSCYLGNFILWASRLFKNSFC